jgi:hypothetical protein
MILKGVGAILTSEFEKELPGFLKFFQEMRAILTSYGVRQCDLDDLLKCLYEACEKRILIDQDRERARVEEPDYRRARKRMEALEKLLGKALQPLITAQEQYSEEVKSICGPSEFDELIKQLKHAHLCTQQVQQIEAANVHPNAEVAEKNRWQLKTCPGHVQTIPVALPI